MLALELDKCDVKPFMGRLLREDTFDGFQVRSIELVTLTRVTIDGGLESNGFAAWGILRPLVYSIIKASPKPRFIKIVFSYDGEVHPNAAALFVNLTYENDSVTFTTATAQKEFAMDKTLDHAWDDWILRFFAQKGISILERE